jgi:hypothetical protein
VRALALAAVVLAVVAALPPAAAGAPLERHAPVVVHDEDETDPLTSVQAFAGRVPGVRPGRPRPALYARRAGPWLQYWMVFARSDQDRGVVHTGRREGDWQVVQYRLERGRVVEGVYGQHGGAERCGPTGLRFRRRRPVVFLAAGSHAAYFIPGLRDRAWPAPNDEADGRGAAVRPRVVRVGGDRGGWVRRPERWGGTRAGWVPGERDSPQGPAFAPPGAWHDPGAWAAAAGPCRAERCNERGECDQPETLMAAGLAGLGLIAVAVLARRRLRAIAPPSPPAPR